MCFLAEVILPASTMTIRKGHVLISHRYASSVLTLLMLRLLSSKHKNAEIFENFFKPCHVGNHWKALAESYQMSTHLPGFQSFLSFFRVTFFLPNLPPAAREFNLTDIFYSSVSMA